MRKIFLPASFCLLLSANGIGQDKQTIKFGKITTADFVVSSPVIDSNTNAVVLSDIASSEFEGNSKGWFSLVFKRHKRVKILNNKGFDAANVRISLYSNGADAEKLEDLKAVTHNVENGAVVTTRLESQDLFSEKIKKNLLEKKFTFPAIKAGSIIEYTYSIKSDFLFNLQPWEFQGEYPCLWSEYRAGIPDFFNYVVLSQGYLPFHSKKTDNHYKSFAVRTSGGVGSSDRTISISSSVAEHKWIIKDAPALKEESFTSTLSNHIAKIEFQLSEYRFPDQPVQEIMASWPKVSEKLLEREDFGLAYTRPNNWLNDDIKLIIKGAVTQEEKARKIFGYIRDNFTCTSTYGVYVSSATDLKDVFRKKSGSVSDLNLLLIAMLRHESINAEPVLLSLRSRGVAHAIYPLLDRFNYLISEVPLSTGNVYLDASRPMLGFNKLPASCYNGVAWVLSATPYDLWLPADSLKENKWTSLFIINNDKGRMEGSFTSKLGEYESFALRDKMTKLKKEEYLKELRKGMTESIDIVNLELDSLKTYEEPVSIKYDLKFNFDGDDVIYFNPLLGEAMTKNPFTSAQRFYPVEMPYTVDEVFVLDMDIPKGYLADEIPKSVRYKFNEDEGLFEYICVKTASKIQMRCRVAINRANFPQEDYEPLRDFFSFIIKKQSEQIVFKKMK